MQKDGLPQGFTALVELSAEITQTVPGLMAEWFSILFGSEANRMKRSRSHFEEFRKFADFQIRDAGANRLLGKL